MEWLIGLMSVVGTMVVAIVYIVNFFKTRHTERLALIKYGKTADVFYGKNSLRRTMKIGLLLFSVGGGMLVGTIFSKAFGIDGPELVFACMMILGGLSLLYYYRSAKDSNEDFGNDFKFPHNADDDFTV
jgi:hypothetical protein